MTNYKENVMETNRQTISSVFGKPAKPLAKPEILGVFTLSIALSIPTPNSPIGRVKHVTLATWRGVTKEECYELKSRFFNHNDEYDFESGIVTGKWQVIEYV